MRRFILTLTVICAGIFQCYGTQHIFYVDLSAENTSMDSTHAHIKNKVEFIDNANLLLYISNGDEPMVCKTKEEIDEAFDKLNYMPNTSIPDEYYDVDSLNRFSSNMAPLKGVNKEPRKVDEQVVFHFYLHPEQIQRYRQLKNIVQKVLLTNRLLNDKGKLVDNCQVKINLDCNKRSMTKCRENLNTYRKRYEHYEIKHY